MITYDFTDVTFERIQGGKINKETPSGVGKYRVFGGIVRGHFLRNSNIADFGEFEIYFQGNWRNFHAIRTSYDHSYVIFLQLSMT